MAMPQQDILERNLQALKERYPLLFEKISGGPFRSPGKISPAPDGCVNLLFESGPAGQQLWAYNPGNLSLDLNYILTRVAEDFCGLSVFIGLGLGYGPLHLLRNRPALTRMVVLEPSLDLFYCALQYVDLVPLLSSPRVAFFIGDWDWGLFENQVRDYALSLDISIMRHAPSLGWRPELYKKTGERAFAVLNELSTSGGTSSALGLTFLMNRMQNLTLLPHARLLDDLKDTFRKKPAVIVAAGPSLNKSLAALAAGRDRCLIIAADTALAPLVNAGIRPDFVTTLDASEITFEKFAPFLAGPPFFNLIAQWRALPRNLQSIPTHHLFIATEEHLPQQWLNRITGGREPVPDISCVAHLSLAAALIMGADPVIFAGQDLSYTDTAEFAAGALTLRYDTPAFTMRVPGVCGGEVVTDRTYLVIKSRIEKIITACGERTFLNTSTGGARIEGTVFREMGEVLAPLPAEPLDPPQVIAQTLAALPAVEVMSFTGRCREILGEIARAQAIFEEMQPQLARLRKECQTVNRAGKRYAALDALPPGIKKASTAIQKQINAIEGYEDLWEQISELTFQHLAEVKKQEAGHQDILKKEGALPWLLARLETISFMNRVRSEALPLYRQELVRLVDYLEKEQALLAGDGRRDPGKRRQLAALYLEAGNYQLAQGVLPAGPAAEDGATALLMMASVQASLLNFAAAKACWEKAAEIDPALKPAIAQSRLAAAAPWLENLEKNEPGHHLFPLWLSRVFELEAGQEAAVAGRLSPLWEKTRAEVEKGFGQQRFDAGRRLLAAWDPAKNLFPAWHVLQSQLLQQTEGDEAALRFLESHQSELTSEPEFLQHYARVLFEAGRHAEGITALRQAVALDARTASLWEELGDALGDGGDITAALSAYEQCFLALPEHYDVLRKMGDTYLKARQPEAAVAAYQAVLARDPANRLAADHLAVARAGF